MLQLFVPEWPDLKCSMVVVLQVPKVPTPELQLETLVLSSEPCTASVPSTLGPSATKVPMTAS